MGGDRRLLWSGVAVLLLVTTVILSLTLLRNAASPARQVRFDISPPDNTTFSGAAFAPGHISGRFLPDRKHFVYTKSSLVEGMSGIFVGSVAAKPEQQDSKPLIATRVGRVVYAPATDNSRVGHLLYNREGTLFAQGFDAARLELRGDPVPVAEQIAEAGNPRRPGAFSISGNGTLAYRREEPAAGMPVWVDPGDRKPTPILDAPLARLDQLQLSPDGRRLAAIVAGDVWVYDLGGRPPLRLTSDGRNDMLLWSPDGTRILFTRASERLLSIPLDLAGATPEPVSPSGHFHPVGWSSDGRELVAVQGTYSATGYDILGIPLHERREPRGIVRTPSQEGVGGAALSPDGRWLAYTSDATGQMEIWVQPYPGPGAPIRVSPHGGGDPHWASDGRHLYYIQSTRMMDVAIESGPAFDFKPPTFLFDVLDTHRFPVQSYDVARDGRFITIKPVATRASADPIHVILNSTAGVTK